MIKGAIFDFDGTLFDSMHVWKDVAATYLRNRGIEPKPGLRDIVKRQSLDQSSQYCKDEYGLEESAAVIKAGFNNIVAKRYAEEVLPKKYVPEFLTKLENAGVKMCLATATDRHHIEAALKRCNLEHFFSAILTCSEVGHGKDEPVIFEKALEVMGTDQSDTIVFEDAYHAIETAKAGGFLVAGVYDSDEEHCEKVKSRSDVYIPDFEHLDEFWQFAGKI